MIDKEWFKLVFNERLFKSLKATFGWLNSNEDAAEPDLDSKARELYLLLSKKRIFMDSGIEDYIEEVSEIIEPEDIDKPPTNFEREYQPKKAFIRNRIINGLSNFILVP